MDIACLSLNSVSEDHLDDFGNGSLADNFIGFFLFFFSLFPFSSLSGFLPADRLKRFGNSIGRTGVSSQSRFEIFLRDLYHLDNQLVFFRQELKGVLHFDVIHFHHADTKRFPVLFERDETILLGRFVWNQTNNFRRYFKVLPDYIFFFCFFVLGIFAFYCHFTL